MSGFLMAVAQRLLSQHEPGRRRPTHVVFIGGTILVLAAMLASCVLQTQNRLLSSFSPFSSYTGVFPVDSQSTKKLSLDDSDPPREVPESFRMHAFPKWGEGERQQQAAGTKEDGGGIQLSALLQFVDDVVRKDPSVGQYSEALLYLWGHGLPDDSPFSPGPGPKQGLWVSEMLRSRTVNNPTSYWIVPRFQAVKKALKRAYKYLSIRMNDTPAKERWPALTRVMDGGLVDIPILLWHSDLKGCNKNNYRNMSVPLLTMCANVHCNYSFPFPSYQTVRDSLPDKQRWDAYLERQAIESPWAHKRNQIVWRGSLSGPVPRIRLGTFAAQHRGHPLVDMGIHRLPANKTCSDEVLRKVIMMLPPIPAENFSNYKAILDIDGNSWSSRFGRLLCRNSVIVKVEPEYVEYFYKHLTPWRHYIPVREDLGDLLETIEWIMDPSNEGRVLQIVAAANDWCREHMTRWGVTYDVLDVLNEYVNFLDQNDAEWETRWRSSIARLWDPQARLDLTRLL